MIRVSVLMPVYNTAPYLRECLDSVLKQTERSIELICVDDGSTDGSLRILERYAKRDRRVRVFRSDHQGAGAARNMALQYASGRYLSILDADDVFHADMLKKAADRADATNASVVIFRHNRLDQRDGHRFDLPHMSAASKFPKTDLFSTEDVSKVSGNWLMTIYGWTWDKLFRRSFVDRQAVRFQELRVFNDMFFTYAVLAACQRITYIPDVLLWQRVNRPGAITGKVQNNWQLVVSGLFALRNHLECKGLYRQNRQDFLTYALHMLLFVMRQLNGAELQAARSAIPGLALRMLGIDLNDDLFKGSPEADEMRKCQQIGTSVPSVAKPCLQASKASSMVSRPLMAGSRGFRQGFVAGLFSVGAILENPQGVLSRTIKCYCDEGFVYTLKRMLVLGHRQS